MLLFSCFGSLCKAGILTNCCKIICKQRMDCNKHITSLTAIARSRRLNNVAKRNVFQKSITAPNTTFLRVTDHYYTNKGLPRRCIHTSRKLCNEYDVETIKNQFLSVEKYLINREKEYQALFERLSDEETVRTIPHEKLSEINKRFRELTPLITRLKSINHVKTDVAGLKEMTKEVENSKDKELLEMASDDMQKAELLLIDLKKQVLDLLTPDEEADDHDVIIELSAGVGGQEAMLFTKLMCDLYVGYATWKNWDCQILMYDTNDIGGVRKANLSVSGQNVYKYLKYESGVHRVQRVPSTERSGRIHTSTMTVAMFPRPQQIDVTINPKDLEMQFKKASGAGGQHVNTTDSAVRITHIPSGIVVECQVDRSQIRNKAIAMETLRAKLYQKQLDDQIQEKHQSRKLQVGSAARSEKVRTYNFPQDRVSDHRIVMNKHGVEQFMKGQSEFNDLARSLMRADKYERIKYLGDE